MVVVGSRTSLEVGRLWNSAPGILNRVARMVMEQGLLA